jgi:hypothetical protein
MVVEALSPLTESPGPMPRRRTFTVVHWFAELLIDCEEDRVLRAVLVGMLREAGADAIGEGAGPRVVPRGGRPN